MANEIVEEGELLPKLSTSSFAANGTKDADANCSIRIRVPFGLAEKAAGRRQAEERASQAEAELKQLRVELARLKKPAANRKRRK